MQKSRFFISWIACGIIMFSLSYLWHGIILNDFERLTYPRTTFLTLAALVYLGISLALVALNTFLEINKKPIIKGIVLGLILGFFIYLTTFVMGISFNSTPKFAYIALDVSWQVFEQGLGGLICGLVFDYFLMREKMLT